MILEVRRIGNGRWEVAVIRPGANPTYLVVYSYQDARELAALLGELIGEPVSVRQVREEVVGEDE
ncbi:hypothetical protein phiKo_24 [Thermus phage phiKo]|nr:hypothetical protein phiKo_24 [Thermus phage phiKo]